MHRRVVLECHLFTPVCSSNSVRKHFRSEKASINFKPIEVALYFYSPRFRSNGNKFWTHPIRSSSSHYHNIYMYIGISNMLIHRLLHGCSPFTVMDWTVKPINKTPRPTEARVVDTLRQAAEECGCARSTRPSWPRRPASTEAMWPMRDSVMDVWNPFRKPGGKSITMDIWNFGEA